MRHKDSKWIKLADKVVCTGMAHLETFFQEIIAKGGEGVILRDPSSPNQPGRSQGYLKHKVSYFISFTFDFVKTLIRNSETLKLK